MNPMIFKTIKNIRRLFSSIDAILFSSIHDMEWANEMIGDTKCIMGCVPCENNKETPHTKIINPDASDFLISDMTHLLGDVFPGYFIDDVSNHLPVNLKSFCKSASPISKRSETIGRSNFLYLFWCQFISNSKAVSSSFIKHITHIVSLCAKKKMVRIGTRGGIAFVQYPKTFWNRAIMDFPRDSMGIAIRSHASISSGCSSSPLPACISFLNEFPESFGERFGKMFLHWKLTPFSAMPQVAQTTLGLFAT